MPSARDLLKRFNTMKTLPQVELRLSKLISDEDSSMAEFEEVIKMDPTLVARLLRLVNSSYYGLQQRVQSISRAVVFIGVKNLRNMVVTEALRSIYKKSPDAEVFSRNRLWFHCVTVGICGQMIFERIFEQKGEDAFLCGILHDFGMIVEDQVVRDLFIQVCRSYDPGSKSLVEYEKEIIGTDHCEVGHLLAREWKLPKEIREGIRKHHDTLEQVSPSSVTGAIQISEYVAFKLNHTALPGMNGFLSPPLGEHLRENLKEYRALVKDLPEEISKAKEIYEIQEE